jgi:hypothetical protein
MHLLHSLCHDLLEIGPVQGAEVEKLGTAALVVAVAKGALEKGGQLKSLPLNTVMAMIWPKTGKMARKDSTYFVAKRMGLEEQIPYREMFAVQNDWDQVLDFLVAECELVQPAVLHYLETARSSRCRAENSTEDLSFSSLDLVGEKL